MNKSKFLTMLFIIFNLNVAHASEHHSGHNMGGSGGGGMDACMKPQLSKFLPANLAMVAPNSEFSFSAFYVEKPNQISVKVKNIPVTVNAEFKDPFYVVKGKLPAELKNTVARITVKVSGKSQHCETESGWLVKIVEQ